LPGHILIIQETGKGGAYTGGALFSLLTVLLMRRRRYVGWKISDSCRRNVFKEGI
jgi:hypothetical protein